MTDKGLASDQATETVSKLKTQNEEKKKQNETKKNEAKLSAKKQQQKSDTLKRQAENET